MKVLHELNTKEDSLTNVGNQTDCWQPLTYMGGEEMLCKSMDTSNFLVTNIVQNIVFCVQQMKENHTGLEQHAGEQIIFIEGPFLGELCL